MRTLHKFHVTNSSEVRSQVVYLLIHDNQSSRFSEKQREQNGTRRRISYKTIINSLLEESYKAQPINNTKLIKTKPSLAHDSPK
jgi:hypothetical protein